jgi:hypothetical protein
LLARKVEGNDRALTMLIADEVDRIAKLIDQMQTLSRRTAEPVEPCNLHRHPPRLFGDDRGRQRRTSPPRASRRSSIPRCRRCWAARMGWCRC